MTRLFTLFKVSVLLKRAAVHNLGIIAILIQ